MKRQQQLGFISAILLALMLEVPQASAHPMMPLSYWQNLRNCSAVYVVPDELNLTNNSTENQEYDVILVGGGGGGGVSTAGTRGMTTQGRFVLEPVQNMQVIVGGGGGAGGFYTAGSGGAGYYGGGGGGAETANAFGGGGGGGSSAVLKNGVVLFFAYGGKGGGSASSSLSGGNGGTDVSGGTGGIVTAAFQGFSGEYLKGGQSFCSAGTKGVELISGAIGAAGGKANLDGGSYGQKGLTSGSFVSGCTDASGGGGFGSSGGAKAPAYIGNASANWAQVFTVGSLQGAGGIANSNGHSGSAGMVVLCLRKTADLLVGFPGMTTANLNTVVTSPTRTVLGTLGTSKSISVAGPGNPEISIDGGAWVTSGTISYGQSLALRQTSAAGASLTMTATVTLGTNSFTWDVKTAQPLSLSFVDMTAQGASALVTSAPATVVGSGSVNVSLHGDGNPEFQINGGSWVTSGTITGGDSVVVRLTTNARINRINYATFRCLTCQDMALARWSVTTGTFLFPNLGHFPNMQLNTLQESNADTVSGTMPGNYVCNTSAGVEMSIDGGPWVTTGSIGVGTVVQLRGYSSTMQNTTISRTVNCLDLWSGFSMSTHSVTYPAFTNLTNQGKNLIVYSETRTITTALTSAPVSVSEASGAAQISINGGAWANSGTVSNGDTLQARVTSAPTNMTARTVGVTIAGLSVNWVVTTGNGIQLAIPNVNNATPSTTFTSSAIVNTGAPGSLAVSSSVPIADFSLDGGTTWVTSATVGAGQSVLFRASYEGAGTTTVVNVTLDGQPSNAWELNDGTAYNPTILAASTPLVGSAGMAAIVTSNADDSSLALTLPFNVTLSSVTTNTWYACSNGFVNLIQSSTAYSSLSGSNPPYPKIFLGAADNSWQRVWSISGNNYYRLRYEGTASTNGTPGSPNIVYELTFFKAMGGKQYIQVVFGTHNRATGAFGVSSPSVFYVNGGTITPNSSYVFEGDLLGENWVMHANSSIVGPGINL